MQSTCCRTTFIKTILPTYIIVKTPACSAPADGFSKRSVPAHEFQNENCCTTYERSGLHRCFSCSRADSSRGVSDHVLREEGFCEKTFCHHCCFRRKCTLHSRHLHLHDLPRDQTFDVQVNVEQDRITAISLNNLSETTAAMYPLMEPALDSIASQIYVNQTTEGSSTERTTATPPNCSSLRSIRRSNRLKILPPQNPDLSMQKGLEAFFCSEAFFLSCISKFDSLHQFGLSLFLSVFPVLFFTAGRVPLSRASRTHHSAYAGRRAGIPQRFRPSGHPAGRSV